MSTELRKGIFLIAAPSLRDPNFRQTVVLLCEHGPEGALGVIVNRPTAMSISEALPQVPVIEGSSHVLYAGDRCRRIKSCCSIVAIRFRTMHTMCSMESVLGATSVWSNGFLPDPAPQKSFVPTSDTQDGRPASWKMR